VVDRRFDNSETSKRRKTFGAHMTRKTRPYNEVLLQRLGDPAVASHYLDVTLENSPDNFATAIKNVAKAREMAQERCDVAKHAPKDQLVR